MANAKNAPADSSDDGWGTVSEVSATQVSLEIGDVFTGIKRGSEVLTANDGNEFTVYYFEAKNVGTSGLEEDEFCSFAESHKLKKLAEVPDGHMVRITRVKDVDVNRPQPMKDYRIESKA